MYFYLIQGFVLGFSAGATPGPFQAYLLSQTLKNGWHRTVLAAFAPLLSDGPIIILVLGILTHIPTWFLVGLQTLGGIYILYLAWKTFMAVINPTNAAEFEITPKGQSLWEATVMNALNPNPYIFWSTILGPVLLEAWHISSFHGAAFMFGFYGAMISFSIGLVFIFGKARQLGDTATKILNALSGLALLIFGAMQIFTLF